ncbi:MAG: DUF2779 domain-containing protein [Nitrospiraceae bacterium]
MATVEPRLQAMKELLASGQVPPSSGAKHCRSPYECPFWDHCTQDKSPRWIFRLPGSKKTFAHLILKDRHDRSDSDEVELSPVQRLVKEQKEWIGSGLRQALDTVRFQSITSTSRPSCRQCRSMRTPGPTKCCRFSGPTIERADGTLDHAEYLSRDAQDAREGLVVALLEALSREGSICVYSSYERSILEAHGGNLPRPSPEH